MKFAPLLLAMLLSPVTALADDTVQLAVRPQAFENISNDDNALNDLAFYALSLSGTPYKFSGNSPDTGFDCSGFVGHVFNHSLGINLPRSTDEIWQIGQEISKDQLQPGDLVFYNTLKSAFSHVGIYLGDDRFVHSPSNGGSIRVDNMRENYWQRHYNGARRISLIR